MKSNVAILVRPLRGKTISRVVLGAALLFSAASHASTYVFGDYLSGDGPTDTLNFAALTVVDESGGDWTFTLSVYGLDSFGNDSFVGALAVGNEDETANVTGVTDWADVKDVTYSSGSGPGGSSSYLFRFDIGSGGNSNDLNRLTNNESVTWTVSDLTGFSLLALHVQGIGDLAQDSGWYDSNETLVPPSVIPLPPAAWLFGSALAGLGALVCRSQARSKAESVTA